MEGAKNHLLGLNELSFLSCWMPDKLA